MKRFFLFLFYCGALLPSFAQTGEPLSFKVGQTVDVWDPLTRGWYPSSVLKAEEGNYFIHYTNYDAKWDTWVTPERVRPAGSGNKNDPGPANSGTGNNNKGAAVSTNAGPGTLPIIYWKDKSLVFRIGDPVLYEYKGKKIVYTIANIDYNGKYKGMKSHGYSGEDIDLNKVELVAAYPYNHYPAAPVNGSGDKFREGDKVEVLCRFDQFADYKWEKGIVVSVDGDNYYVYRPGTDRNTEMEYFWHYINDVRAIGSAKTTNTPPRYGRENTNPDKANYFQALKSASCPGSSKWDFMWYYRHDFNPLYGHAPVEVFNNDNFKKMTDAYDCMYEIRKSYPDIGISGPEINDRYDVQWEFLQNRKQYITEGLKRIGQGTFNAFLLDVKNARYEQELAAFKGEETLKKTLAAVMKKYDDYAAIAGSKIDYDWSLLDKAYQEGLQKFNSDVTVPYQGLKYGDNTYSGKDARAEAIAVKYVLSRFPGSKIMASGTSGDFYINKNDIGLPNNRAKGIVVLHQNPNYRTCILTYCFYQEDYAGGGKFGEGYINSQLDGDQYLKTCKKKLYLLITKPAVAGFVISQRISLLPGIPIAAVTPQADPGLSGVGYNARPVAFAGTPHKQKRRRPLKC